MKHSGMLRRFAIASMAILAAGLLMRAQLSSALVVRGDEYLYRARPAEAARFYRRALFFDASDAAAIDRIDVLAILAHNAGQLRSAVWVSSAYLAAHPGDATIRADRALVYRLLGRDDRAQADFGIAGAQRGDPLDLSFAASLARAHGNLARARTYWRAALKSDPRYAPALRGLGRRP